MAFGTMRPAIMTQAPADPAAAPAAAPPNRWGNALGKFGNILDPESEVSQILRTKHVYVLKQEVGTLPRFYYYFDEDYPRVMKKVSKRLDDDARERRGGCA